MTKTYISIFALLLLASCAVSKTKLSTDGKKVKILSSKKARGCNVVEKVVGINKNGSVDVAKNHARNLVARAGGNAVYFDDTIQNGSVWKVHSTAFECEE